MLFNPGVIPGEYHSMKKTGCDNQETSQYSGKIIIRRMKTIIRIQKIINDDWKLKDKHGLTTRGHSMAIF